MEHNKIDTKIKKMLELRKVQPKETTWNRLEMLLDEDEKKTKKGLYVKYIVAASVVLFLGMFFVLNSLKQHESTPTIVVTPTIKKVDVNKKEFKEKKTIPVNTNTNIAVVKPIVKKTNILKVGKSKKKKISKAEQKDITPFEIIKKEQAPITVLAENNSVNEAELFKKNQLNNEVDSLLSEALTQQNNTIQQSLIVDKNLEANANALLGSVEQELDASFKEKVFKKIKKGLLQTGTAINNRNK